MFKTFLVSFEETIFFRNAINIPCTKENKYLNKQINN